MPHVHWHRRHLDPDRHRELGHRVRQEPLPRGVHQGGLCQALDREDRQRILKTKKPAIENTNRAFLAALGVFYCLPLPINIYSSKFLYPVKTGNGYRNEMQLTKLKAVSM